MEPRGDADSFLSWSVGEGVSGESADAGPAEQELTASTRSRRELGRGSVWDGVYRIEEALGKGAMGVVYRATDRSGKQVALKVLSAQRLSEKARIRLRREGELTAALRHPGIVGIHSAGEVEGVPYLAYELVPQAKTLHDVLGRVDRRRGIELIRQTAEALGYAHHHGVTHRDVKPSNVLVDGQGQARVADFGLARAEGAEALTRTGALVGTPAYMAPEQLVGENARVGPPADVWALGVILYEHLVGERPYDAAEGFAELSARVVAGRLRPPRRVDPTIPRDLEAICLKCLAVEIPQRYPTGAEVALDLANALADRPVTASSHQLVRQRLRRSWRTLLAAAIGALLVAGLATLGWSWLDARLAASARQDELREALRVYGEEGQGASRLASLLAEDATSLAELRARAHLALASDPQTSWEDREQHARRAQALDPGLGPEVLVPLAEALRWQGRAVEAAEVYAEALRAGADPTLELERARVLLEAGEVRAAIAAGQAYLEAHRYAPSGLELLGRAQLAAGDLDAARETAASLQRVQPGPAAAVLAARVRAAEGGDVYPVLAEALERWPEDPAPAVAMAWSYLTQASAPRAALAVLQRALDRGAEDPELERLSGLLRAWVASPPQLERLRASPSAHVEAAVRALWHEGQRCAGIWRLWLDPCFERGAEADVEGWRDRAAQALQAAYALARAPARRDAIGVDLAGLLEPEEEAAALLDAALRAGVGGARACWLRARIDLAVGEPAAALRSLEGAGDDPTAARWRALALIRLGRVAEARAWVERGLDPERLDLRACQHALRICEEGQLHELAAELRERVAVLEGERAEEAGALYVRTAGTRKGKSLDELILELDAVLALDPHHGEAALERYQLEVLTRRDQVEGARGLLGLGSWSPRWLGQGWLGLNLFGKTGAIRFRAVDLEQIRGRIDPPAPQDRLLWAFLSAASVYVEERVALAEPALRMLDDVVRDEPGDYVGWLLRGVLGLRQGRLDLAAHDLERAWEAAPTCGMVRFHQAMLAAAQGAEASRVLRLLGEAEALDHEPYDQETTWNPGHYPMMEPYRHVPGFERFFRGD